MSMDTYETAVWSANGLADMSPCMLCRSRLESIRMVVEWKVNRRMGIATFTAGVMAMSRLLRMSSRDRRASRCRRRLSRWRG